MKEPFFQTRHEWMVVTWNPEIQQWLPPAPPCDRPEAATRLAAARLAYPERQWRLVRVSTVYTVEDSNEGT